MQAATVTKEGFLSKQGHLIKSWRNRWFVLEGLRLSYAPQKGNKAKEKVIDLRNARLSKVSQVRFKITLPGGNEFLIQAENEATLKEWVNAISTNIKGRLPKVDDRSSIVAEDTSTAPDIQSPAALDGSESDGDLPPGAMDPREALLGGGSKKPKAEPVVSAAAEPDPVIDAPPQRMEGAAGLEEGLIVKNPQKQREFEAIFRLEGDEKLLNHFTCGLLRDTVVAGTLYISELYAAFSNQTGTEKQIIPFNRVVGYRLLDAHKVLTKVIEVETKDAKYYFSNWLKGAREKAYAMIVQLSPVPEVKVTLVTPTPGEDNGRPSVPSFDSLAPIDSDMFNSMRSTGSNRRAARRDDDDFDDDPTAPPADMSINAGRARRKGPAVPQVYLSGTIDIDKAKNVRRATFSPMLPLMRVSETPIDAERVAAKVKITVPRSIAFSRVFSAMVVCDPAGTYSVQYDTDAPPCRVNQHELISLGTFVEFLFTQREEKGDKNTAKQKLLVYADSQCGNCGQTFYVMPPMDLKLADENTPLVMPSGGTTTVTGEWADEDEGCCKRCCRCKCCCKCCQNRCTIL